MEEQAKQSMAVEKECLDIELKWKEHSDSLEKDIEKWKKAYELEKTKTEKLREHLSRTERELYGILQRKYELIRGPATSKSSNTNMNKASKNDNENLSSPNLLKRNDNSWTDQSETFPKPNIKESKKTREKRILAELCDFLGF